MLESTFIQNQPKYLPNRIAVQIVAPASCSASSAFDISTFPSAIGYNSLAASTALNEEEAVAFNISKVRREDSNSDNISITSISYDRQNGTRTAPFLGFLSSDYKIGKISRTANSQMKSTEYLPNVGADLELASTKNQASEAFA